MPSLFRWGGIVSMRRLPGALSFYEQPPADPNGAYPPYNVPETPHTPPEMRLPPDGSDAAWQNAPTIYSPQPQPTPPWQREITQPNRFPPPGPGHQSPLLWAVLVLGVMVLLLAGTLAYIGLTHGNGANSLGTAGKTATALHATATITRQPTTNATASPSSTLTATPSPTGVLSVTPTSGAGGFQDGQTYTYNDIIGHSKQTAFTNNDINVTLVTLALSSQTTISVSF
ncbi:MAG TPA: hypothetical protein VKQ36_14135, partial [Ktedonobacterales bacterium]|nr:hypothetical protein [Ktedonobacterales bacterium]